MSRPLRIEYPEAWYHIMNRGRRSEKIFLTRKDYETFIELLVEASKLWSVNIVAFVLMPNHYHLLINTPKGNLSRFMRHLNGVYTQRFNKNNNLEGQVFRGRFKSILVNGDSYLLQLIKYIHKNPLRAKLVKNIDDFEWSSHQGYISTSKYWNWLDKKKLKGYREFMEQPEKRETVKILEGKKWPAFFASDEFIFSMKKKYYKHKIDKEIPSSRILTPDINRIKGVVCKFYKISDEELYIKKRRYYNEPRDVAIFLSRKLRNDTLEKLSKEFSLNSHSSVSSIMARMKKSMLNDSKLKKRITKIEKLCLKNMR